jgi:uncharacterized protein (TIGR00266 family)
MLAMDSGAAIEGKMQGGLWQAIKRTVLTNESFFVTSITARENGTEVYLAPRAVGDIEVIELKEQEYVVQGGAFLAATDGIATDAKFTGWKGFVSGEGIFMIKAKGTGTMFVSSFGGIFKKDIPAGKTFIVDNGHIVAFPSSMKYDIHSVGGDMVSMVTTGEGIFMIKAKGTGTMFVSSFGGIFKKDIPAGKTFIVDNGHIVAFPSSMKYDIHSVGGDMVSMVTTGEGLACSFTGPGTVYLQTRNLRTFAETLNPFLPQRDKAQGRGILGQVFG